MAAQVSLPGVGPVSKRALLFGGAAAALVMGVIWWRKRQAAAAAPATSADTSSTDTSGLDAAALSGLGSGGINLSGGAGSTFNPPSSNPQWVQAAMQELALTADPNALASALGLYVTGQAVTPDQETLIDQAIAVEGYPPVAGPNGYPPAIRTQPAPGQGGGGAVPGPVTGLRATEWGLSHASFAWGAVTGATSYVISQPNGQPREVSGTEATVGCALGGNVHYPFTFTVAAKNSAGTGPAASTTIASAGGTR